MGDYDMRANLGSDDVDAMQVELKRKYRQVSRHDVKVTFRIPSTDREMKLVDTAKLFELLVGFLVDRGVASTIIVRGEQVGDAHQLTPVALAVVYLDRGSYYRLLPQIVAALGWLMTESGHEHASIEVGGILCLAGELRDL